MSSPMNAETPSSVRNKIQPIDTLAGQVAKLKAAGHRVVQAHGTFDLLHLGHVRHLEQAKRLGDILIVTVTADSFVNKGPGRPVFPENLRAEMLAALEYVDWVGINNHSDAVPAINALKPSIYAKGQDYQNPEGDVTGKITEEREAVELHGGSLTFTNEITFSSSELINRHLNVFEPHVRDHLNSVREDGGETEVFRLLDQIAGMRVLIIGEAIIDEYRYVQPMGKSSKENMIATRFQDAEYFAGGVIAAANHVANFCSEVEVITCLGSRDRYEELIQESLQSNVKLNAVTVDGAPTTRKCRFIDPGYMRKLFEVYHMDDRPVNEDEQSNLVSLISEKAGDFDVVIVTDFGHGMMVPKVIQAIGEKAKFLAVNAQSNSANMGFNLVTRYPKADYICIDAPEARLATGDRVSTLADVVVHQLAQKVDCSRIVVTHGKYGCVVFEDGHAAHTIPAFTQSVVDTVGAGDAFFAVTAPIVAAGASMRVVGFVGNVVGGLKVEIVGHRRSVDKVSLLKSVTSLLR